MFKILPGVKVGLSNIVLLYAFYKFSYKESLIIGILKAFLSALLFSGLMSFFYSLFGVFLSVVSMIMLTRLFKVNISVIGISIASSAMFNVGQIIASMIILLNTAPVYYLSILFFCSVINGMITGFITKILLNRI